MVEDIDGIEIFLLGGVETVIDLIQGAEEDDQEHKDHHGYAQGVGSKAVE